MLIFFPVFFIPKWLSFYWRECFWACLFHAFSFSKAQDCSPARTGKTPFVFVLEFCVQFQVFEFQRGGNRFFLQEILKAVDPSLSYFLQKSKFFLFFCQTFEWTGFSFFQHLWKCLIHWTRLSWQLFLESGRICFDSKKYLEV